MTFVVIGLGALAAFLFAAAAALQQRAAIAELEHEGSRPDSRAAVRKIVPLLRGLVHSGTWLYGWLVNLTGFGTQAVALHLGSVAAVQPLMATQIVFTVPLGAASSGVRPRRRDWGYALTICAGLALLFATENSAPLSGTPERGRVLLGVLAAVVLVLVVLGLSQYGTQRAASFFVAIGAGVCFAMSAVFMKLTATDLVDRGVAATAADWPGYLLAVSTLSGLLLGQAAYAGGSLPWAIAAMSVTNPVVSYAAGLLAFNVPIPSAPGTLAAIAGAGALVTVGITGLAHSPTALRMYGKEEDDDSPTGASDARTSG